MMDHGALTDLVLDALATNMATLTAPDPAPKVGDGVAPVDGGWADGQPGTGVFVPYVTLVSGGAAPRALSPGSHIPVWAVGFSVRCTGGSRKQCDWVATTARRALTGLDKQKFGDPEWKVINVEWASLGPVTRTDATSPAIWSVYDTITVVVDA
jgi:hypothetical protein